MSSDHRDRQSRAHRAIANMMGRNTTDIWLCTEARHRDGVDMPDTGLHPHREAMYKQHTHSQSNRAVCPSATHTSTKSRDRTTPTGMCSQQRKDNGDQSTIWRGHTKPTTSPKEEKEGGTSAKGSVVILTCVPLPHLVLPLSGCACSGTPTKATRGEARGHP